MNLLFSFTFKAMGSPCELQIDSDSKAQAEITYSQVKARVDELEARYSRFIPSSLVSQINRASGSGQKVSIDDETVALLRYAQQCYEESDGLFDITSGILRIIWNFKETQSSAYKKISTQQIQQQIDQILPLVNWNNVAWDNKSILLLKKGMEIDFGGIVKEYTADCIKELCLLAGVKSGYINMGGDLCIIGPQENGDGWPIAIQHPENKQTMLGTFTLKKGALASSGDYERYIMINEKCYSHVINPKTGWPVSGIKSVSVATDHCITAGSISTIAMLKGKQGLKWLKKTGANYLCYTHNGKSYYNF
jgi:thiamine biosynthesis lipoprotein